MIAVYGGADWADEQAKTQLMQAYSRRIRHEAKLQAIEIRRLLFGETGNSNDRVTPDEMMQMAGVTWQ